MSEEKDKTQLSPEEVATYKRQRLIALNIARNAVELANISQNQLNNEEEFTSSRWQVSYSELNQDIILTIQLNPYTTTAIIHTSLVYVSWEILRSMESLLSNPKTLKLLAVEENERESIIFNKAILLMRDYIFQLPIVFFHSFHQALNESIISHIKKIIDYDMREYFESIGKPQKKFTLLPNDNLTDLLKLFPSMESDLITLLEKTNEEFSAYRKGAFSDRKVWLNSQEAFLKLPSDYELLKIEYKKVKKEYKTNRKAFFITNRQAEINDWEKHWKNFCSKEYPNLYFTNDVQSYTPSELAFRQLGDKFGFSVSYMEILVRNAKEQIINSGKRKN